MWIFQPVLADDFFAKNWVTASLLKSVGLFSVFWPILSSYFQVFQSLYQFVGVSITIDITVTFMLQSVLIL